MAKSANGGGAAEGFGGAAAERSGGEAVRRGGRVEPRRKAKGAPKVRLHLAVSAECEKRLGVHCVMAEVDKNELVEQLILAYMRRSGKGQEAFGGTAEPAAAEDESPAAAGSAVIAEIHSTLAGRARTRLPFPTPNTGEDRQDRTAS